MVYASSLWWNDAMQFIAFSEILHAMSEFHCVMESTHAIRGK